MNEHGKLVALSGASGFVGKALAKELASGFRVRGLGRGKTAPKDAQLDDWCMTDLYSLRAAQVALDGAEVAIYLVHSMMPNARLTQARFEDLDLLCADNFGRAAATAGVKQIVYLGGLVPSDGKMSPHLQSRHEVTQALGKYGTPVTTLRAGLILGGTGSSFEMLVNLVERLPVMICPSWTATRTQPVAVADVIKLLAFVVNNPACFGKTYDIGAPEALSYKELLELTAELLGLKRTMLPVRWFSPALSRLWVSTITGASKELVAPLVESLKHEMVAQNQELATMAGITPMSVRDALKAALDSREASRPQTRGSVTRSLVRSVQRMTLPNGKDAAWASAEYTRWLPSAFAGLLKVDVDEANTCSFRVVGMKSPLLVLTHRAEESTQDRQLFHVTGGLLAQAGQHGRFELRAALDANMLLTAIHDFEPRLPWFIYRISQAPFHAWVMAGFAKHLARNAE
jgi:uncharacterized protein YbjT (DUF2867 family)